MRVLALNPTWEHLRDLQPAPLQKVADEKRLEPAVGIALVAIVAKRHLGPILFHSSPATGDEIEGNVYGAGVIPNSVEKSDPVHLRHVPIRDDGIKPLVPVENQPGFQAVQGSHRFVAVDFYKSPYAIGDFFIIVDNKYSLHY